MKESKFTNYDELPLFLNAKLVAQTLGIGLPAHTSSCTMRASRLCGSAAAS